ncbi:MAG: 3-oxoacyl-[acyl-carrier protein] reductase [Chloroflexota bacterium]|nr:3-oxoacyl-[acyl-carrier protein] reductase [Chloroflexota bacterium]
MDLGLKDKVAVVAGASKGLGFATAQVLLEEGAQVVISSRSAENLKAAADKLGNPPNLLTVPADVTKEADCQHLIQACVDKFKALDVLITNCGGPAPGSFEGLSDAQWDEAIDKSFKSNLYLIRAALPHLKQSSTPSILTVTSFTTKQPLPNMILSNSVRSATIGLTKSLTFELGQYNIRVNSILPGWTLTDRVDALLANRADIHNSSYDAEKHGIAADIPLGRMGEPLEFGRAAAFLVSPAASFINGVMLNVDGGIYKGIY